MNEDRDHLSDDQELRDTVRQFEQMLRDGRYVFFDAHQFETIIDYYLDVNNTTQALKTTQLALERYPTSSILLIKKAQLLLGSGDPLEALRVLNQVGIHEAQSAEIFLLKGSAYADMGKPKEATRLFREALNHSYEDKADVLHQIAYSFERQNDFKTAIRYLREGLELEPANPQLLYDIAWCYDRLEEDENAILYYGKYLDKDPFADHVWYNLGMVCTRSEDFDKAVEAFDFAIAIDHEYSSAYYGKANALASLFEFHKAIEVYNEYLFLDEDNPDVLIAIGECYERLHQYDKAIENYTRVTELEPGYADAWFGLGVVNYFLGDFQQSVHFITKAIEFYDEEGEYWFSLGNVLVKLFDYESALKAYARATELDPTDTESWLNSSEVYFKQDNIGMAISTLEESCSYNDDNGLINYRLAAFHFINKQADLGLQHLEKALNLDFESLHELFEFYSDAENDRRILDLIDRHKSNNNIL
jgi:tetratricopeptide (TPR) repeat protein